MKLKDIKIKKKTLQKVFNYTEDSSKEIGGLLIGSLADDFLIIDDAITGNQSSTPIHFSLSEDFLVEVAKKFGESEDYIVGWFHSHPGFGCFLSSIDRATQKIYQSLFKHAVALVIDPVRKSHKFFRIIEEEVVELDYQTFE